MAWQILKILVNSPNEFIFSRLKMENKGGGKGEREKFFEMKKGWHGFLCEATKAEENYVFF